MSGPRARAPVYAPGCRYSHSAPLRDTITSLAAVIGAGVATLAYHDCNSTSGDDRCGLRAGVAATSQRVGLILAASASYGFSTAHVSRQAEAAHARAAPHRHRRTPR